MFVLKYYHYITIICLWFFKNVNPFILFYYCYLLIVFFTLLGHPHIVFFKYYFRNFLGLFCR